MVQGLAFLSKKSWHTKNLANQEKVWMAEEKKKAEANKTKELARQIQQEREQEELERISGQKSGALDRGIDWMYQGAAADSELAKQDAAKQAEEFLLGKEFVGGPAAGPTGDFAAPSQLEGVEAVVKAVQPEDSKPAAVVAPPVSYAAAEPSVAERNESFRLRTEDPMYFVSQKQRENQIKDEKRMALYERVVGPVQVVSSKDKKKKSKKDRKKERKRDRKRRDRSRSPEQRKHESSRRRRRRDRSESPEDRKYSRRRIEYSDESSRGEDPPDRRHYQSSDDDSSYQRRRYRREDEERRRGRNRNEKQPRWEGRPMSAGRRRERSDSSDGEDSGGRYRRKPSRREKYDEATSRDSQHQDDKGPRRKEGYGLQGAVSTQLHGKNDLGPSQELLRRKREERTAHKRRIRETASSRRHRTDEERAEALSAMQSDAQRREDARQRHEATRSSNDHEEAVTGGRGKASFLKDMAEEAHGIRGDQSLASRVAMNRNTNQKSHESFL